MPTTIMSTKKRLQQVRALSGPEAVEDGGLPSVRPWKNAGFSDGMTLSFHHHFREGDYVVNMVMEEVHRMGSQGHHHLRQLPGKGQ